MTDGYRAFLKWTRTLHIYLTLIAFFLLLFFAATGFILNHEDWFGLEQAQTRTVEGSFPVALLEEPDKLGVVEKLRGEFGATGAMDSFEVEDDLLKVVFKSPGRTTDAMIHRDDGKVEVLYESWGVIGHLTDLHRGKGTGPEWQLLIDGVSIFVMLVGVTGLVLWTTLQRRRVLGAVALVVGLAVGVVVYWMFVP